MHLVNKLKNLFKKKPISQDFDDSVPAHCIPNELIPNVIFEHNMLIINCGFNKQYGMFVICGYLLDTEIEV